MNDLKYIVVIPPGFNEQGARAIIFNGLVVHSQMVPQQQKMKVVGAGFMRLGIKKGTSELQVQCFGESTSLNISSRKQDAEIVRRTLTRRHPMTGFVAN